MEGGSMQDIQDLMDILQEKSMDAEYYFAENDEYPSQIDVDSDFIIALENSIAALKELKQYRNRNNRLDFTEKEIEQIKYALEHLHDADLSDYGEENLRRLESAMQKLGMEFSFQLN